MLTIAGTDYVVIAGPDEELDIPVEITGTLGFGSRGLVPWSFHEPVRCSGQLACTCKAMVPDVAQDVRSSLHIGCNADEKEMSDFFEHELLHLFHKRPLGCTPRICSRQWAYIFRIISPNITDVADRLGWTGSVYERSHIPWTWRFHLRPSRE